MSVCRGTSWMRGEMVVAMLPRRQGRVLVLASVLQYTVLSIYLYLDSGSSICTVFVFISGLGLNALESLENNLR